jgi:hypothetical protein
MTARESLARMHAEIKAGAYDTTNAAEFFALAAIAEALVQIAEPVEVPR